MVSYNKNNKKATKQQKRKQRKQEQQKQNEQKHVTKARHFQYPCFLQQTSIIWIVTINIPCITVARSLISVLNFHFIFLTLCYFLGSLLPITLCLI
jgi:hypothetical protein